MYRTQEASWDLTTTGPIASNWHNGYLDSSGPSDVFGYTINLSGSGCNGAIWDWDLDVTGGGIGVVLYKETATSVDDDYYPLYTGDSSVTYKVMADSPYAYVRVMTPWTKAWQAQQKVTATVVASELIGVAESDMATTQLHTTAPSRSPDVSTSGQVTFTWENFGVRVNHLQPSGAVWVRVDMCEIASECFFDWKTHGPFRTGSFSMTNTRIPELKDTWMLFDFNASDAAYLFARIEPTSWWQYATLYYSVGGVRSAAG